MLRPSIDTLAQKVDSKYTLVVAAAKRARELVSGKNPVVRTRSSKPVTVALEEVEAGKLRYERTKTGIK